METKKEVVLETTIEELERIVAPLMYQHDHTWAGFLD